jgi:hypothetical protein
MAGLNTKTRDSLSRPPAGLQARLQGLVHNPFEGNPFTVGELLKPPSQIIIERQSRSHGDIMMLR